MRQTKSNVNNKSSASTFSFLGNWFCTLTTFGTCLAVRFAGSESFGTWLIPYDRLMQLYGLTTLFNANFETVFDGAHWRLYQLCNNYDVAEPFNSICQHDSLARSRAVWRHMRNPNAPEIFNGFLSQALMSYLFICLTYTFLRVFFDVKGLFRLASLVLACDVVYKCLVLEL